MSARSCCISRDEGIVWSQLRELDANTQFAKFDTDGNGSIDADELLAAMHACGHASSTAKDAQALMREHGDGEPPALDNAQFQQVLESIDSTDHVTWQQEQVYVHQYKIHLFTSIRIYVVLHI